MSLNNSELTNQQPNKKNNLKWLRKQSNSVRNTSMNTNMSKWSVFLRKYQSGATLRRYNNIAIILSLLLTTALPVPKVA